MAKSVQASRKRQLVAFEPDVREWLEQESERQERSMAWLVNDCVRRRMIELERRRSGKGESDEA